MRISQQAASSTDWTMMNQIPTNRDSSLYEQYLKKVNDLSQKAFHGAQYGEVFMVVVKHGEAYEIDSDSPPPMNDNGKPNAAELSAYKMRKTAYTPVPISDSDGTYLAAYTPILRNGNVIGLVAAEFDSGTLRDIQTIVRRAFWLSVLPAFVLSLIVAFILASMFVDPMEVFRRIDETAREPLAEGGAGPLNALSSREMEVAELVRQGLTNPQIAEQLHVSVETVKQHLKNIKEKTGFNKVDLAVHVEAARQRQTAA